MKAIIHANIWEKEEDALLIEDGIIQKLGKTEEIVKELEDTDEVIDLRDSFVLPGFIDTHIHLLSLGYALSSVSLKNVRSLEEIENILKENLPKEKEKWLYARNYNETLSNDKKGPTKAFLDSISKEVPIVLVRACGHILVANSKAIELAGITESAEYENGKIDYERGVFEEKAMDLILAFRKNPTRSEFKDYLAKASKEVNKYGITTVCSDDFLALTDDYKEPLDFFLQEAYQGNMTVRVYEQCEFQKAEDLANFLDEGYTTGVGDDFFEIGPLKMILDGSLGGHTAALTKPYLDTKTTGTLLYEEEELKEMIHLANTYNMPTISHAIGDKAVDQALKVYEEELLEDNPLGYGLVHTQIMRKDQIQKIIEKKICCLYQSLFIDADASMLKERIDPSFSKTSYPYKSLYDGVLCTNGSDAPVETPDVLKGIYLAVTRKSLLTKDTMNQEECLTVEEAIKTYTENGAKLIQHFDTRGKIEEGYFADLVVLDKDITNCPPEEILNTKVLITFVNGEEVYTR